MRDDSSSWKAFFTVTLYAFLPIDAYTRKENLPWNAGKSGITTITLKLAPSLQKNKQNKKTRTAANKAVFKWLSKNQNQSNYSDQSRQGQTARWTNHNSSQLPEIFFKAREKSRVHGAIGFGFASHWLKNWRESFKPITKRSNCNHVITFDSHLKTAPNKSKDINLTFMFFGSEICWLKCGDYAFSLRWEM